MLRVGEYEFKRAEDEDEFEQIHRLNFRTFVSEIPQHEDTGDDRLVDKFHDKNAYFIAIHKGEVVGMVSVHDQAPFSVADRLSDPGILTRPDVQPLEVRLLAVDPGRRNSTVFYGLVYLIYEHSRTQGYTHLFASGHVDRLALYQQLGFEPLGPPVGSGHATFVPMMVTFERLASKHERSIGMWHKHQQRLAAKHAEPVCLLPGPVTIADNVREAFHRSPTYHRGSEFIGQYQAVRRQLALMSGAHDVAILNGSGTLANEVVAATLAAGPNPGRGLLLVNGEFGERLLRQAARFGLYPRVLNWEWGRPWDFNQVEDALAEQPEGTWVWGVHQESSTGVLNDLPGLVRIAKAKGIRVCADCISSLGAVPLDLQDVYLATGATGKSLGSYAGAALIFANVDRLAGVDSSRIPSYFDLPAALGNEGPRYTFPSPTLQALATALDAYGTQEKMWQRYEHYSAQGVYVRQQLRQCGLEPLADDSFACPVVTTFAPPGSTAAQDFVKRCRRRGFAIGGESGYLAERRFVQIATMGAITRESIEPLFEFLHKEADRLAKQLV